MQWSNRWGVAGLLMLVFTGAALLGTEPLRAAEKAGRAKPKSSADADKSADAAQDAIRQEIASLQKAGNWRGLVTKLKDRNPAVRRQAAFALQRVAPNVKHSAELKQLLPPLVAATLNDSSAEVHKHARFALRDVLSKVEDEAALIPVAQSFLAGLSYKDPKVRAHCAHDLGVVSKIKNEAALARMMGPLTAATLRSESTDAPDFPGFSLRNVLERMDDQETLVPIMNLLVNGLKHKDPTMRGFCIHELSGIVSKIEDERVLQSTIGPLNAATLEAESMDARDFAGFALRVVLRKTSDERALIPVMQTSLAGLKHKDSSMRAYYAHALYENVSKIEDKTVLVRMVNPLTAAALEVEDSGDGGLKAPNLAYMALKQVLDKVDDQTALKSIVSPMAEALKGEEVKRRRYAAHAVMLFAHKVKDKAALWPLVQPLVAAHFHDPDEAARRSAGLALERTFGRVSEPN